MKGPNSAAELAEALRVMTAETGCEKTGGPR